MKLRAGLINRRHFIAAAGMTAVAGKASALSRAVPRAPEFAFAASGEQLRAYSLHETVWTPIQTIPSEAPVSLVSDASRQTLHVLHAVREYQGLARGYIESFRVDTDSGYLRLLARQPLSLSATRPGHMALSADGKALAVAVRGGAAYNLLPILEDGRVGKPIAIRKETARNSAFPSSPSHVIFHPAGDRIFTLDQGTATLSVFSARAGLPVLARLALPGNRRLAHSALYADANLLFVVDEASGSLLTIQHDSASGDLSLQSQMVAQGFRGPCAIHRTTQTLYAAAVDSIHLYRMQAVTGKLSLIGKATCREAGVAVRSLVPDARGQALYLTSEDGVFRSGIDADSGRLSPFVQVAPGAGAIAFLAT